KRCGTCQYKTCNLRYDYCKGHRGKETQQEVATYRISQVHRYHIGAANQVGQHVEGTIRPGLEVLGMLDQQGDGTETDDEGQQVEVANKAAGVDHGFTGFLGIGHGKETHQDMRQTCGTEGQGNTQGQHVQRVAADSCAGFKNGVSGGVCFHGSGQHGIDIPVERGQNQNSHQGS